MRIPAFTIEEEHACLIQYGERGLHLCMRLVNDLVDFPELSFALVEVLLRSSEVRKGLNNLGLAPCLTRKPRCGIEKEGEGRCIDRAT